MLNGGFFPTWDIPIYREGPTGVKKNTIQHHLFFLSITSFNASFLTISVTFLSNFSILDNNLKSSINTITNPKKIRVLRFSPNPRVIEI